MIKVTALTDPLQQTGSVVQLNSRRGSHFNHLIAFTQIKYLIFALEFVNRKLWPPDFDQHVCVCWCERAFTKALKLC